MNFQIVTKFKSITNRLLSYYPNLTQSWLLFGFFILCHFAEFAVKTIIQYAAAATQEWALLSGNVAKYIVLALFVVRLSKHSNDMPIIFTKPSHFIWFLLVPFTLAVNMTATSLTLWIPQPVFVKQLFENVFKINFPAFLYIVVVAAVCEEWLCRGIILKGLMKHYSPRKAIVWSSVIFSVLHFNPWQGVTAFFMGLAFGWIYWHTRSLRYCIFMHVVNNATAFLLLFLFQNSPDEYSLADIAGGYYIYVVTLFVCLLCVLGIKKLLNTRNFNVQTSAR